MCFLCRRRSFPSMTSIWSMLWMRPSSSSQTSTVPMLGSVILLRSSGRMALQLLAPSSGRYSPPQEGVRGTRTRQSSVTCPAALSITLPLSRSLCSLLSVRFQRSTRAGSGSSRGLRGRRGRSGSLGSVSKMMRVQFTSSSFDSLPRIETSSRWGSNPQSSA